MIFDRCEFFSILLGGALTLALPHSALGACTAGNPNANITETTPTADFTDNGDGTVVHTKTGLSWMRCSLGQSWSGGACTGAGITYTWDNALYAARDVNMLTSGADNDGLRGYAGRSDWRIPDGNELQSIAEYCGYRPAINQAIFPQTPSAYFWSSSTFAYDKYSAWEVNFDNGSFGAYFKNVDNHLNPVNYNVRLVRGGQ